MGYIHFYVEEKIKNFFEQYAVYWLFFWSKTAWSKFYLPSQRLFYRLGIIILLISPLRIPYLFYAGCVFIRTNPLSSTLWSIPGTGIIFDQKETALLIKYFLTCLTVPQEDLWVNLSPYESGRIISQ